MDTLSIQVLHTTVSIHSVLGEVVGQVVKSMTQLQDGIPNMYWPDLAGPIVNPHNYTFLINQEDICTKRRPDLFLVAIVHTSPANFRRRMMIRETWASQSIYDQVH